MYVVKLDKPDAEAIAKALSLGTYEFLIAYDPIDEAVKVRIDGWTWSPPMGELVSSPRPDSDSKPDLDWLNSLRRENR